MTDWIDLEAGVRVAFFNAPGGVPRGGLFVEHPRPDGTGRCMGTIHFYDAPRPETPWIPLQKWELVSESPLTVTPSLDCRACGWHHWIRGGRVE